MFHSQYPTVARFPVQWIYDGSQDRPARQAA